MNAIEFLNMVKRRAIDYAPDAVESIKRNGHMFAGLNPEPPTHDQCAMVLTDFINAMGAFNGIDYALYASDVVPV